MKTATSMMSLATPAPPVPSFVQKDIMVRDKFLYGMKWNGGKLFSSFSAVNGTIFTKENIDANIIRPGATADNVPDPRSLDLLRSLLRHMVG